jgi:hypothetical protein
VETAISTLKRDQTVLKVLVKLQKQNYEKKTNMVWKRSVPTIL